jgi:conjugal transfer pilus assembly protein TraK
MMQKHRRILLKILLGVFLVSSSVFASVSPVDLHGENGSTFSMTVSRDNPNLLIVQGDPITAITSKAGVLLESEKTANGALLFETVSEKPFTFVVETVSGQVFSFQATSVKGQGKTYRILSRSQVIQEEAKAWEKTTDYDELLVALNKGVLTGRLPEGYQLIDDSKKTLLMGKSMKGEQLAVWSGGSLRVEKYRLTHSYTSQQSLNEADFWEKGVRSVMFFPQTTSLSSGASTSLYLVREQRGQP